MTRPKPLSQQISQADFEEFDVIIGMDSNNVRDLQKMAPAHAQNKIFQFAEKSVPDPWYTGDFDETYEMVKKGCQDWLDRLQSFDQE